MMKILLLKTLIQMEAQTGWHLCIYGPVSLYGVTAVEAAPTHLSLSVPF